jgi:hypothetical protein
LASLLFFSTLFLLPLSIIVALLDVIPPVQCDCTYSLMPLLLLLNTQCWYSMLFLLLNNALPHVQTLFLFLLFNTTFPHASPQLKWVYIFKRKTKCVYHWKKWKINFQFCHLD